MESESGTEIADPGFGMPSLVIKNKKLNHCTRRSYICRRSFTISYIFMSIVLFRIPSLFPLPPLNFFLQLIYYMFIVLQTAFLEYQNEKL